MKEIHTSVARYLFEELREDEFVYAVLDGASIPDLLDRLYSENRPEFECLYRGELEPDIAEVAPYLVWVNPDTEFANWLFANGWGQHWGIFAIAPADLATMHRHFRKFLTVHDPDGKPLLFRYYDPRVIRIYLPTCNADEFQTVFGPIRCFVLEDDDPRTAVRFRYESGTLATDKLPLAPPTGG
jgi:hypothetical protein